MFDAQSIAFNGTTIPATQATTTAPANPGLDMGPTVTVETWECIVKALAGTTPTFAWKVQESDDGTTWTDASESHSILAAAGSAQDFQTVVSPKRYRRGSYTTTAGAADLSGTVTMGPITGGGEGNRF